MSETGSFRSASPKELETNTVPDEVLDDHRHQTSLPVRMAPDEGRHSPLVAPDEAPNFDDATIQYDNISHKHGFASTMNQGIPVDESLNDHRHQSLSIRVDDTSKNEFRSKSSVPMKMADESAIDDDPNYPYGDEYEYGPIPIVRGSGGSLAAAARRGREAKNRSHLFSEQIRCLANPKETRVNRDQPELPKGTVNKEQNRLVNKEQSRLVNKEQAPQTTGILRNSDRGGDPIEAEPTFTVLPKKFKRSGSIEQTLARVRSGEERERRASRSSIDSEDSQALRSSQETEEDVCFPPMLREHVRIKGIDFDEIEEFIKEERESARAMREQQDMIAERTRLRVMDGRPDAVSSLRSLRSSAALKYTPKNILNRLKNERSRSTHMHAPSINTAMEAPGSSESSVGEKEDVHIAFEDDKHEQYGGIRFGGARITEPSELTLPDRFSFFSSESEETVHAPDMPSLVAPGQTMRELFRNGESTWWLDCVCPTDAEMKTLARAFGIHPLTAEDIRMQETREKVELFRNYYFVCFHTFEPDKESEDYLEPINVYLVVFRDGVLSFHFSPISHPALVRRRVRQLRDYVDVSADWICYAMIDDITDEFAPVITAIEYEADAIEDSVFVARETDFSSMLQRIGESRKKVMTLMRLLSGKADVIKMFAKRCQEEASTVDHHPIGFNEDGTGGISFGNDTGVYKQQPAAVFHDSMAGGRAQPRADIALYLGDIQDHVVTMFQNLLAYEKIFSRSHSNYLAQLQVESFNSNNRVTEMFSKVTLIGTILVPLNLVTGLFGMNVRVPGEGVSSLQWFFGILGFMVFMILVSFIGAKMWIDRALKTGAPAPETLRRSIRSFGMRRTRDAARSVLSFPNKYD